MRVVDTEKSIRQIVRSAVGNMLEKMAINIAKLFYVVEKSVELNGYYLFDKKTNRRHFFIQEKFVIDKDFWNLVCCSDRGYEIVIDEYKKCVYLINSALENNLNNNAFYEASNKILNKVA